MLKKELIEENKRLSRKLVEFDARNKKLLKNNLALNERIQWADNTIEQLKETVAEFDKNKQFGVHLRKSRVKSLNETERKYKVLINTYDKLYKEHVDTLHLVKEMARSIVDVAKLVKG